MIKAQLRCSFFSVFLLTLKVFILLYVLSGCSTKTSNGDTAIRQVTDVVDVRISEREPKQSFRNETESLVGFDADGLESLLLLYFPKIQELWAGDVLLSSVTGVELLLTTDEVNVNPENIYLTALSEKWSPLATWNAPFPLVPTLGWNSDWANFARDRQIVTPSLRKIQTDSAEATIELSFDVTAIIMNMIAENSLNYGFVVSVVESDLNAAQILKLNTFNGRNSKGRPRAILAFNSKSVLGR